MSRFLVILLLNFLYSQNAEGYLLRVSQFVSGECPVTNALEVAALLRALVELLRLVVCG